MDMSALFRSVYKTMFPNATLIADRFHVQRLVLWAMERVRKDISKYVPKTSPYLKHNKRILQKRGTTLSGEELVKLRCILSQSDELRRAYILKEAFYKVLRQKTELAAKRELNKGSLSNVGVPTTKSPFRNSARHLPSSFFANSHRESGS